MRARCVTQFLFPRARFNRRRARFNRRRARFNRRRARYMRCIVRLVLPRARYIRLPSRKFTIEVETRKGYPTNVAATQNSCHYNTIGKPLARHLGNISKGIVRLRWSYYGCGATFKNNFRVVRGSKILIHLGARAINRIRMYEMKRSDGLP